MEAILVSQEGKYLMLVQTILYRIGSAPNDEIFILDDQVAPHHAELLYDHAANAWNVVVKEDAVINDDKSVVDSAWHTGQKYNRDVLAENKTTEDNSKMVSSKPKIAYVERAGQYMRLQTKSPYPLQDDDVIILGQPETGYAILFKESENPFPKQHHPPEPYGEALRIKGSDTEVVLPIT